MPSIAAREILPALLPAFLQAHPGITLEVVTNDIFVDVLAAGFDAGIRYDERLEKDMVAIPIGPRRQRFVAAASAAYLAAHGTPGRPRELVSHACIGHRFESGVLAPWEFERRGRRVRITPGGPMISSAVDLERSAAVAGLGHRLFVRGVPAPRHRSGRTGAHPGGMVAEFSWAVPLLSEPHAYASPAPGIC